MKADSFPHEVRKALGFYVYRLVDPRNGSTAYVGKGAGSRAFEHARAEQHYMGGKSKKLARIRAIRQAGLEPLIVIHRHGMDRKTALEVEAALIDAYPEADNLASGWHSERRSASAQELIWRYTAEETKFKHRVLLIRAGQSFARKERSLYDATRYCWKISRRRPAKIEYVLAVEHGLITEVYKPDEWLPAEKMTEFPEHRQRKGRLGFRGHVAPVAVHDLYRGKRIPNALRPRGAANPVRYLHVGWFTQSPAGRPKVQA